MSDSALDWLETSDLVTPVSRLLGAPVDTIVAWTGSKLAGGSGESLGVWEIDGRAISEGMPRAWTIVLKGWGASPASSRPDAWDWPMREGRVYASTLLERLPDGLSAPHCFDHIERSDGSEWIWLERNGPADGRPWPLARYAEAARRMGRFNGSWLAGGALPDDPWLSRDWLVHWAERVAPEIRLIDRAEAHPLVARAFPPDVRQGYWRIWHERSDLYAALDGLTKTVCHLDAFPRNIFLRDDDPAGEMVLIDWSYTGLGVIGEEMAPLIAASLYFGELSADQASSLEAVVLDAYMSGLRDSGWHGDPELVRLGYLIALVLRYGVGCVPQMVRVLSSEAQPVSSLSGNTPPLELLAEHFGILDAWLVERGDELRARRTGSRRHRSRP
jgi:hypothetical protein